MRKFLFLLILIILSGCRIKTPDSVREKISLKAIPFELKDVKLLDSPFKKAMQLDAEWLLGLKPDRLLYQYRLNSGLAPKDSSYSGWEERFSGHILGHYLSACAMMYAASGEESFRNRVNYIIDELDTCQRINGNGYVGGVRNGREIFSEIKKGNIRLRYSGFELNGGRVPWYNMHKLFAGLIDAYLYTGNEKAKAILVRLSDWAVDLLSGISDEQMQKMLLSENGGMNESLAVVYTLTGDHKYFDLAKRFDHKLILDPLTRAKDDLDGRHANSQIPKVIGFLRQFEINGDSMLYNSANFFWNTIVNHHSYVIGGNAESEYLGPPDLIYDRITDFTCENCGTYNMLKLTKLLFEMNPSGERADFYERALYNQILASQNPENGMITYFSGLAFGSSRNYCSFDKSFWCCTGTGFENHAKYGDAIYFKEKENGLYINLFIPSELFWREKDMTLRQETGFPFSDSITIRLSLKHAKRINIKMRYPGWARNGFKIRINGEKQSLSAKPGSYIDLDRKWNDGDLITYLLPMSVTSEPALGSSSFRAYLYGPIVLAADLGFGVSERQTPVVVSDGSKPEELILLKNKDSLVFDMKTGDGTVKLVPYFITGRNTTAVYFKNCSTGEWSREKKNYSVSPFNEMQIEKRTIDLMRIGDSHGEQVHDLSGKNTSQEKYEGFSFLEAENGWFSFKMKVLSDKPVQLIFTCWGNPSKEQAFDIFIDSEFLTNVKISNCGNRLITLRNNIPLDFTINKKEVTIYIKAIDGKSAGPLRDCRIII